MMTEKLYQTLIEKNTEYEGVFFVGITTTGVFCRPTCPARKPKFEHCEFFETAQEALLASYRPCKRCKPLSHPSQVSKLVQMLVQAVEENPEKRMIKNPTRYGYPDQLVFNTKNSKIQDMHYPTAHITYCGNTAKNADRNPEHYMFYNFIHPTPSVYNIMEQDMMNNAAELKS